MHIVCLLGMMPALPLILLGLSGEYWGRIYLLWGAAYAALNGLTLLLLFSRQSRSGGDGPSALRILLYLCITWGLSLPVLAAINLTPLCLGQDNGDGRNTLEMCLLLSVVWFVYMSALVVPLAGAVSLLVRGRLSPARFATADSDGRTTRRESSVRMRSRRTSASSWRVRGRIDLKALGAQLIPYIVRRRSASRAFAQLASWLL